METFERSGRVFQAVQIGRGGPAVFWGTGAHETPEALVRALEGQNLLLVACQAEDWNRCFSPWPAPPAFGSEGFAGEGAQTLRWLTDECAPAIAALFGAREKLLCGYSLAGLFSLWAFYETGAFVGAASSVVSGLAGLHAQENRAAGQPGLPQPGRARGAHKKPRHALRRRCDARAVRGHAGR